MRSPRTASKTTTSSTIELHDFSGHHFPAQLCRQLASRGHEVEHLSSGEWVSGKGHVDRQPDDHQSLRFDTIVLNLPFQKYAPWARGRWEFAYGRAWVARARTTKPASVIACNLPLISLWVFARYARRTRQPWILWHQDIYSVALADELHRRLPRPLARVGSMIVRRMEASIARSATHVVAIGEAFTHVYDGWDVDPACVSVVPNWAPLDRIFPVSRTTERSARMFPDDRELRMVYAGTLGRKHNPLLLAQLVEQVAESGTSVRMAVVSEGEGADDLAGSAPASTGNLDVLPFQPASDLPEVLGSADVLVALLEPSASTFSIPSKVLTYMAAGRPILGLMPHDNPAATDIEAAGGFVVDPDEGGVDQAAAWLAALAADPERRVAIGIQTRELAEKQFDVEDVTSTFEQILSDVIRPSRRRRS